MQLEDLLRTSTKNVAQEVVSSLIPQQGGLGVLADIDRVYGGGDDPLRKASLFRKFNPRSRDEADDGYQDSIDNSEGNFRGGSTAVNRQSKSANAARSLTRKTQQPLRGDSEEVFPH